MSVNKLLKFAEKLSSVPEFSEESSDFIKKSKTAFNVSLIGIATSNLERINKIQEFTGKLEDKLFTEDMMDGRSPEELIQLYLLSSKSNQDYMSFVKDVLKTTKWGQLESDLVEMSIKDVKKGTHLSDVDMKSFVSELVQHIKLEESSNPVKNITEDNSSDNIIDSDTSEIIKPEAVNVDNKITSEIVMGKLNPDTKEELLPEDTEFLNSELTQLKEAFGTKTLENKNVLNSNIGSTIKEIKVNSTFKEDDMDDAIKDVIDTVSTHEIKSESTPRILQDDTAPEDNENEVIICPITGNRMVIPI